MKIFIYVFLTIAIHASSARIMTYNLWEFSGNDDDREDDIKMVIEEIDPDIIVAEELDDIEGFNALGSDVLDQIGSNIYTGAPFIDQSTTYADIGLYYKHDIFEFVSTATINTTNNWGHRDVIEFVMRHISSGVEIRLYGVHLKAGTGSDNETDRAEEAEALRNYLNELSAEDFIFVLGDFNLYNSSEDAWTNLTGSQTDNDGRLFDPIDEVGYWHNSSYFEDVHTQSTRSYYNGQNYGGMDDRFDFILTNATVLDVNSSECYYVEGTYTAFGNYGNHFNQAINSGNNSAVNVDIADALVVGSDHLPVYMDVWFNDLVYSDTRIVITEVMPNPSAVSDSYGEWFEVYNADTVSLDLNGWIIKDDGSDTHTISVTDSLPILPGGYLVFGRNEDSTTNGGFTVDYEYSNFTLGNSTDEVLLVDTENAIVDQVAYTTSFPFGNGASMYLIDMTADNNDGSNWTVSTMPFGDGDYGTPGKAWNDSTLMSIGEQEIIPKMFQLYPAYPNPFNPTTTIRFNIGVADAIMRQPTLKIFDITGRLVETLAEGEINPGQHEFQWNASQHPSGVYFITLKSGNFTQTQKILLLK